MYSNELVELLPTPWSCIFWWFYAELRILYAKTNKQMYVSYQSVTQYRKCIPVKDYSDES